MSEAKPLEGLHIIIVEDEYLIALDVADQLAERGGLVTTLTSGDEALDALAAPLHVDVVVLDVVLKDGIADDLAVVLKRRGIPFVVHTGLDASAIPPSLRPAPRYAKPCDYDELADGIRAVYRAIRDGQIGPSAHLVSEETLGSGDGA
jgi:DNA-binding response OmpR family regulator